MENLKPLFILEMANNHQGSTEHGIRIIREMGRVCRCFADRFDFAIKFQFRELDSFIHPTYRERTDIKNVKRFLSTRLGMEEFRELLCEVRGQGFKAICTPFDEPSVERIVQMGFDYIKIASCSFGDWPLLEKIAAARLPVIASVAGCGLELIDKVVSFFEHRKIELSLMHCVAEYPTPAGRLELNQIDLLKECYPKLRVGFSTHEEPGSLYPVIAAVAKGATIFEKHVGVPEEGICLNAYSANPAEVGRWLEAAALAFEMCGVKDKRYEPSEKELSDLAALKRGAFAKSRIGAGKVSAEDIYLAFPSVPGQLLASDLSKYTEIYLREGSLEKDRPLMLEDLELKSNIETVREFVSAVMKLIRESSIVVPEDSSCELSHHYGLSRYREFGCALIDCVNREYCKKILIVLPGQTNPTHYHLLKEETFIVVYGELIIGQDGAEKTYRRGEMVVVKRGVRHYFRSETGCVFEEISTTHQGSDSYYDEAENFVSPRKTKAYITKEMIESVK